MRILLVGAGLANASLIHFLRSKTSFKGSKFTVIDQRNHVAGNCYTSLDSDYNTLIHVYGPHIFNTNSSLAWEFMNVYLSMHPYVNRVKANTPSGIYSFPINLHTINQFFNSKLGPSQALSLMKEQCAPYQSSSPRNFEEAMLSHLGKALYEEFIYGYTVKQWGVDPASLPASIAKRLPFRLSYDDNYYNKRYQGLPREGYTPLFDKIFGQEDVSLSLDCPFDHGMSKDFDLVIYSGAIDEFFAHQMGRLSYRTVYWERRVSEGLFQGNAVVNYTDIKDPFTRINEPIFFEPWKRDVPQKSLYFIEFSKQTTPLETPYYPMRLDKDKQLLDHYQKMATESDLCKDTRVLFHGRLGTYRYLDMDMVIEESAQLADRLEGEFV